MDIQQSIKLLLVKQLFGFISEKRIQELYEAIMFVIASEKGTNVIVCNRCGSVEDYRTKQNGPHIEAICNGCDRHIKFLSKSFLNNKNKPGGVTQNTMADKIIHGRINVEAFVREWLYKGEKGKYLDITMFYNEEQDEFGQNGMIVQSVPKAVYEKEKEANVPKDKMSKGPILGNLKEFTKGGGRKESTPGYRGEEEKGGTGGSKTDEDDDLPF